MEWELKLEKAWASDQNALNSSEFGGFLGMPHCLNTQNPLERLKMPSALGTLCVSSRIHFRVFLGDMTPAEFVNVLYC